MTLIKDDTYSTATSFTARQINRRIILNIIHRYQPISRADAARRTGLQRSTVSLIADELIREGWIIEGEYGRIPRGRRPIFLQMNLTGARLLGLHVAGNTVNAALADLNGNILWTGQEKFQSAAQDDVRSILVSIKEKIEAVSELAIKGVGIALENTTLTREETSKGAEDIFGNCIVVDNIAFACGEWMLLNPDDVHKTHGYLVSIHTGQPIEIGVIINEQNIRGVNGRAANFSNSDKPEPATPDEVAKKIATVVQAYDPGLILLTGPLVDNTHDLGKHLEKPLKEAGISPELLHILPSGADENNVYLKGAIALVLRHYLAECPI